MEKKIFGILITMLFILTAIPQITAIEINNYKSENNNFFSFCYIRNIADSSTGPAKKCPYVGFLTILGGGENSQTTIYKNKDGEIIGSFTGRQTVFVLVLLGSHEYTGTQRIFSGFAIGVYVNEK